MGVDVGCINHLGHNILNGMCTEQAQVHLKFVLGMIWSGVCGVEVFGQQTCKICRA